MTDPATTAFSLLVRSIDGGDYALSVCVWAGRAYTMKHGDWDIERQVKALHGRFDCRGVARFALPGNCTGFQKSLYQICYSMCNGFVSTVGCILEY